MSLQVSEFMRLIDELQESVSGRFTELAQCALDSKSSEYYLPISWQSSSLGGNMIAESQNGRLTMISQVNVLYP